MDIDDYLDPMFSTQLGSPNNPIDMASEMTWDSILGEDHNALGQ